MSLICPRLVAKDIWVLILEIFPLSMYSTIARLNTHNKTYLYAKYPQEKCMKEILLSVLYPGLAAKLEGKLRVQLLLKDITSPICYSTLILLDQYVPRSIEYE